VLSASLYIILCSARNRLRVRLRRLREPRYLAGAVVGAAYIYFSFFARLRGTRSSAARSRARRNRGGPPIDQVPGLVAAAPVFGGIGLLLIAALGWVAPFESGLLEFSEAERQFLFPAPMTRRQLLVHRLLRLAPAKVDTKYMTPSTSDLKATVKPGTNKITLTVERAAGK